jgi:NADPH:quinone reductase-like Zn-dependent oxidoreductase
MPIPETMTAMLLTGHGGPDKLALHHDVPVPKPGPGEVLVEVSACGMNNTDIKVREGSYGAEDDPNAVSTWRARAGEESTLQFPRIQGADTVGRIVAVGEGVPERRIGERIMVDFCIYNRPEGDDSLRDIDYYGHGRDGGFADYMVVEDGNAIKVESDMDDAELATFSCAYQTGEHMLARAGLAEGETVLITGAAGGVGSGIVQLARARGAIPYAVTSKGKEQPLQDLGAAATIPRQDFQGANRTDEAAFIKAVETAMDGREVDVVADLVGGDMFNGLLRLLRPEGRYTTAGTIGGAVVPLDTRTLYLKHLQLHGSSQGRRQDFRRVVRYIEEGRIKSILHKTWKLSDLQAAQADFVAKSYVGKMAVVPDSKWDQVGARHAR